jgi:predicted nucleic acid-binding protein
MSVVDASVWVSSLLTEDVNHEASRRWLDRQMAEGRPLYGPWILLPEVTGAVARRSGIGRGRTQRVQQQIDSYLARLLILDDLDEALARESARLTIDLGLRGADSVYVAVAVRRGIPLVTWDREQRERSATVVRAVTPGDDLRAS